MPNRETTLTKAGLRGIKILLNHIKAGFFILKSALASRQIELRSPSKKLPFNETTIFRSYNYSAFPAGIITATHTFPATVYAYHIQLFFPSAKLTPAGQEAEHFRFFPGFGVDQFSSLGCLETTMWDRGRIFQRNRINLVYDIIETIRGGKHIFVYTNKFFIPGTAAFKRTDHRHAVLLTGYESTAKCFIGISYLPDGSFGFIKVPFFLLIYGIFSSKDRIPGRYNEAILVREIRALTPRANNDVRSLIIEQIGDYVAGKDNSCEYLGGRFSEPNFKTQKPVYDNKNLAGGFGMEIYPLFKRYMENIESSSLPIDMRATRILTEHKTVMQRCIAILSADKSITHTGLCEEYKRVESLAATIHNLAFAFNQERNHKAISKIIDLLNDLRGYEKATLERVLSATPRPK